MKSEEENRKDYCTQQRVAVHCGQKPATSATQTVSGNQIRKTKNQPRPRKQK